MTGYGHSTGAVEGYRIQLDIKSINHRNREVIVRMPREWILLEDSIRQQVLNSVKRGRVEVWVDIEQMEQADVVIDLNMSLAEQYIQAAERLKERFDVQGHLSLYELLQLPNVLTYHEKKSEISETFKQTLFSLLDEALQQMIEMRKREGTHLYADLMDKIETMERQLQRLKEKSKDTTNELIHRVRNRIDALLGDREIDEYRFHIEAAVLAERASIDEELTRLDSHINQLRCSLQSEEPTGKKMDFIIQEINREINTVGSKTSQIHLSDDVIAMKAELEKIREQVQNIQ